MVLPGMKPVYTSDPKHPGETRAFSWLPNRVRHLFISILGEFIGTYLFLFFAFAGTQVANTPPGDADLPPFTPTLLYISLAFGFSLMVNVWIFFRVSGGIFNPAVTVALALIGAVDWLKAFLLIITQVVASIAAAGMVSALFPGALTVRTTLNSSTSITRGLFIEMLLTAELIFTIFMLAAEKHKATFLAPIGIGLALFICELCGVYFTGGSLNPARSFGPDVILRTFDGYHWIYWVGPMLGAIIAVIFYRLIKLLEYESANPGADSDGHITPGEPRHPSEDPHNSARRRTDGTNESEFPPPRIGKPMSPQRVKTSHFITTSAETENYSIPSQPLPIYQSDGPSSPIDHANERPRAQHRSSADTSNSQYTEAGFDRSYESGPSAESGSS
ncbi:aquaporin-like protein, partial [Polyplosphaeria fusca]